MISEEEEPKGMNAQEERELRRVFDHLAFYRRKKKIQTLISEKMERRTQIESHRKNPTHLVLVDARGNQMEAEDVDKEDQQLVMDIEKKNVELHALQNNLNKCINHEDLFDVLKALGKTCSKKQIENMIWEADENLDGCIDWEELRAMFNRNLIDKTGLEPANLFNIIQFMTYDKKICGTITADDTMAILFARYGRVQLEFRMKNLFGKSDELTFVDYLERVSRKRKKETTLSTNVTSTNTPTSKVDNEQE